MALDIYKGRTTDHVFTLYGPDGVTGLTLTATDKVRAKLGRSHGSTPEMDLVSGTVNGTGSTVLIDDLGPPAQVTVRFGEDETGSLTAGNSVLELLVVDDSETAPPDATKPAGRFEAVVHDSMAGAIG